MERNISYASALATTPDICPYVFAARGYTEGVRIEPNEHAAKKFAEAFNLYADRIFRHCTLRVFDREKAKDLMQDCFCRTWEYIATGNTVENTQAFLYKTANNLIISAARKRRKQTTSLEDLQEAGFDPAGESTNEGEAMDLKTSGERVLPLLRNIPSPYREALVLRFVDDLSPKEMALITGESANVLSVRIHRGLRMLRTLLHHELVA